MGWLNDAGVAQLWQKCKAAFSPIGHTHSGSGGVTGNLLLWSGSVTTGSISVPGSSAYNAFCVVIGDSLIYRLVCARFGDTVHGEDFARSNAGNLHYHLTATTAGDVWTIAQSYNSNGNAKPITAIYGIA